MTHTLFQSLFICRDKTCQEAASVTPSHLKSCGLGPTAHGPRPTVQVPHKDSHPTLVDDQLAVEPSMEVDPPARKNQEWVISR